MSELEKIEALIDDYATKYASKHHISTDEARKHAIVKLTETYFKEDDKNENRTY